MNIFLEEGRKWRNQYITPKAIAWVSVSSRKRDYQDFYLGLFPVNYPLVYSYYKEILETIKDDMYWCFGIPTDKIYIDRCSGDKYMFALTIDRKLFEQIYSMDYVI